MEAGNSQVITNQLEDTLNLAYALRMKEEINAKGKDLCYACQCESNEEHDCSDFKNILERHFNSTLKVLDESKVLSLWKTLSAHIISETDTFYRQKYLCKDWRETCLKTVKWETKLKTIIFKMYHLEQRLCI